ncbi:cation:proton antiporter [Amycolatopsis sp. NPDC098790]|uniref:cation:proton antiporter n=1 Tax=Amycolatopsis sp. NPDC098790 TaxID=3363939 RepID=UPI0038068963
MHLAAPVAPIAAHPLLVFITTVVVMLGLAFLLGRLAQRVGLPAIVGELVTGVLLGPSLLAKVAPGAYNWMFPASAPEQIHLVDAVGQVGVLLLVGITGTHLDTRLMRRNGRTALTVSLCGLLIPLALGVALAFALPSSLTSGGNGGRGTFALFLGVAMCVTAIPVIAKTLSDMRLLHRNIGQLILTAGMIDDAVGWLLLSVVSAAAATGVSAGNVTLAVIYLLVFLLLSVTVLRVVVKKAMTAAARAEGAGPSIVTAMLLMFGGGLLTHALGMEPIFGAFVMGILIARAGAGQRQLAALRTVVLSVLAPLFLASAGLRMDLTALAQPTVALSAVAVLLIAILGKFGGAYLGARLRKLGRAEGLALGAGMNSRGVVEVIIALTGLRLGVLNTATYTIIVLVAIFTSLMAPPLLRRAVNRIEVREEERLRKLDHDAWNGQLEPAEPRRPEGDDVDRAA